jgi:hypothetical protein
MNIHAIQYNQRAIRIVQNLILKYDCIFDPANKHDIRLKQTELLATHIVKNLKKNGFMKTLQ